MAGSISKSLRTPGTEPRRRDRFPGIRLLLALAWMGFFLTGLPSESGAFEVRAWVDKAEATLEDQIFLTVSVSGQRRLPSDPILPPLPDFSVTKGGTSSQTRIVNGSINTSVEATYLLTPKRTGTFTIGPVRIERKGRTYQSKPLAVKILPAASSAGERPLAFVTQQVDVEAPYVHQQIVYTFRFHRKVQSVEAQWDPPTFEGFWVEDLGKEKQYEKVINGQRYAVTELKKALYPLSESSGDIGETRLLCKLVVQKRGAQREMDSFFGTSFFGTRGQTITKNLGARPIPLEIRPLPDEGRPEGFAGLVGSFSVQAEIGQNRLRVGDSTTLTVTVTGNGNLRDLVELSPEEMPGFKVYPDKPSFEAGIRGDTLHGTKVFKKALVPIEPGNLEIPPQEVPYFDPLKGSYQVASTGPITLTVEENGETEPLHLVTATALPGSKSSIKILGKDILPIHTGLAGARKQSPSGMRLYLAVAGLLLPPLVFFTCYGTKRRQERLETDQHIVRRKEARKKALRLLREAKKRIRRPEDKEYFGELARCLKGLVGDKLNLNTLAFTPVELERCLLDRGVEGEKAQEARAFLEELEYDQYVSTKLEAGEREARHKKAQKLLALLDKRL
jgi:hypothetical protein